MPRNNTRRPSVETELRLPYGVLTFAYLAGIYWLSSLPGLGMRRGDSLVQLASNVFHILLFAGLTFCLVQVLAGRQRRQQVSWRLSGLAFLGTGALAALDEWHQSFVPGRHSSLSDLMLDLVGIGGMLLLVRLEAFREVDL